jgi:heme o synthase
LEHHRDTNVSITDRAVVSRRGRVRATLFDYVALTKPRTIQLVVGAIPAMLLADRGVVAPNQITLRLTRFGPAWEIQ